MSPLTPLHCNWRLSRRSLMPIGQPWMPLCRHLTTPHCYLAHLCLLASFRCLPIAMSRLLFPTDASLSTINAFRRLLTHLSCPLTLPRGHLTPLRHPLLRPYHLLMAPCRHHLRPSHCHVTLPRPLLPPRHLLAHPTSLLFDLKCVFARQFLMSFIVLLHDPLTHLRHILTPLHRFWLIFSCPLTLFCYILMILITFKQIPLPWSPPGDGMVPPS